MIFNEPIEEFPMISAPSHDDNQNPTNNHKTLDWAARSGDNETIRVLVLAGADVNAKTSLLEDTLLHVAARMGHSETVRVLVQLGAVVNATDHQKSTPLHQAALNGKTQTIRVLIELGANKNATDSCGRSPLIYAVGEGHSDTVRVLVEEFGVNVMTRDIYRGTKRLLYMLLQSRINLKLFLFLYLGLAL